jgi:hypothetical protein
VPDDGAVRVFGDQSTTQGPQASSMLNYRAEATLSKASPLY